MQVDADGKCVAGGDLVAWVRVGCGEMGSQ
jgi:hypothetical protein